MFASRSICSCFHTSINYTIFTIIHSIVSPPTTSYMPMEFFEYSFIYSLFDCLISTSRDPTPIPSYILFFIETSWNSINLKPYTREPEIWFIFLYYYLEASILRTIFIFIHLNFLPLFLLPNHTICLSLIRKGAS